MSEEVHWIKENRLEQGLTQEQLAKEVGVSVSTVKRWEKNQTEPKMSDLRNLYSVLKIRRKL